MWFTSYEGLNRYDGKEFFVYKEIKSDSNTIVGSTTTGLVEDFQGNIWVGTESCLNRYNRSTNDFDQIYIRDEKGNIQNAEHLPFYADSLNIWYINGLEGIVTYNFHNQNKRVITKDFKYSGSNYIINSTYMGLDGQIWFREEVGIVRINPKDGSSNYYFSNHPSNLVGPPTATHSFFEHEDGYILIGTDQGLLKFHPETSTYEILSVIENRQSFISAIKTDAEGNLFLGTELGGVTILDEKMQFLRTLSADSRNKLELANNSGATIYIDPDNLAWINVDPEGIDVLVPDFKPFNKFAENIFDPNIYNTYGTRCFLELPNDKMWVGTQENGLILFDPDKNKIEKRLFKDMISAFNENYASCLYPSRSGDIWVGTYDGLYKMDQEGTEARLIVNRSNPKNFNSSNLIWDLLETPDGTIFISTDAGIYYLLQNELEPRMLDTLNNYETGVIKLDNLDRLYISENFKGFYVTDYKEFIKSNGKVGLKHFLPEFNIKYFYPLTDLSITWLATNTGLLKVWHQKDWSRIDSLKHFTTQDGLPSDFIYTIIPDETGRFWMSTNRGVTCFDPLKETFSNYTVEDGLQGFEFNTNAFLKTKDGKIYLGGTNGFNSFYPRDIESNPVKPPVPYLTHFLVNGKEYNSETYIGEINSLQLDHNQNTFTFSFAALDFLSSGANNFQVKLEGFDEDWIDIGTRSTVRYTKVPPANYVFKVKAANDDGLWNETPKELEIIILPPWYRTWWAYALGLLLLAFIAIAIYRFQIKNEIAQQEALRLKELDAFKTRFYSNITHEFRTPLTVILGMAEELRNNSGDQDKKLELIQNNGMALLGLVNQILDLSKIQAGQLDANYIQGDVVRNLAQLVGSFESYARSKNLDLQFHSEAEQIIMDYDEEKLNTILSNLLSNAFKFTPKYGKVLVLADRMEHDSESLLKIKVRDTGKGISREDLDAIFNRFYQSNAKSNYTGSGSGLGLAIVKEMIDVLDGEISVESKEDKGTTFTIQLPIRNKASFRQGTAPQKKFASTQPGGSGTDTALITEEELETQMQSDVPVLLIIEDNADVVYYLQQCLQNQYRIHVSSDGEEGINKALELSPDIIISDVMMPSKDGFEVCETLKSDQRTSHIPIILLTAKSTDQDKLEGLKRGADAYLLKPFRKEELEVRLEKLVELRRSLMQRYSGQFELIQNHQEQTNLESSFLQKLNEVIENNLDNTEFNIQQLCQAMAMSRVQVHRKLKALTGNSTSRHVRSYRLHKAKALIQSTDLTISEIAYTTGFGNLSYFTKSYKEEFGEAPTTTRA